MITIYQSADGEPDAIIGSFSSAAEAAHALAIMQRVTLAPGCAIWAQVEGAGRTVCVTPAPVAAPCFGLGYQLAAHDELDGPIVPLVEGATLPVPAAPDASDPLAIFRQ